MGIFLYIGPFAINIHRSFVFLFVATHGNNGPTVRIGIPRLFVDLQRTLGRHQPDECRNFGGQMVDFVRVLARTVFPAQQRMVGERLILDHLDALAAARLVLRRLSHGVQLRHLVLNKINIKY